MTSSARQTLGVQCVGGVREGYIYKHIKTKAWLHRQRAEVSVKCLQAYANEIQASTVYNGQNKYEDMYNTML